jgi:hypothetical protein
MKILDQNSRGPRLPNTSIEHSHKPSPLGHTILIKKFNIRMDLGEVGWKDVDWIGLAQDRDRWRALVNSVLNLRVP